RPSGRPSAAPSAHPSLPTRTVPPSRPPSIPPPRPPLPSYPPGALASMGPRGSSMPATQRSSGSIRVAAARGRVKGAALLWFADAHGEAQMARVLDLASPELRAMLRIADPAFGIMASGWYDTQL